MGIPAKSRINEYYKDRDWLYHMYTVEGYSRKGIGDLCGVNENTVRYYMLKYGIAGRNGSSKMTDRVRSHMSDSRRGRDPWNKGLAGSYHKWTKRGVDAPGYKGGVSERGSRGYRKILVPDHPCPDANGYVSEHRLVCEQILGRYLTKEETVHHRDSDRMNNSPDNLFIFSSNSDHIKYHQAKRKDNTLTEEEFCERHGFKYCNLRCVTKR